MGVELVEGDHAGVRGPVRRLPRDPVVLPPLGDLAFPPAAAEPDLLLPRDLVSVLLLDVQDAVHELRELVELRPPLVDDVDRRRDVGPALNRESTSLAARAASAELPGDARHLADRTAFALEFLGRALADLRDLLAALLLELWLDTSEEIGRLADGIRRGEAAKARGRRHDQTLLQIAVRVTDELVLALLDSAFDIFELVLSHRSVLQHRECV